MSAQSPPLTSGIVVITGSNNFDPSTSDFPVLAGAVITEAAFLAESVSLLMGFGSEEGDLNVTSTTATTSGIVVIDLFPDALPFVVPDFTNKRIFPVLPQFIGFDPGESQGGGGLASVVEDTTPQLGGSLDAQNNDITNVNTLLVDTVSGTSSSVLFSGNAVTLRNEIDSAARLQIDSGDTSSQIAQIVFSDRGSDKWSVQKGSGNAFVITDDTTGNNSLHLLSGNTTNNALTVNAGGQVGIAGFASGGNQLDVSGDAARIRGTGATFTVDDTAGVGTNIVFRSNGLKAWTFRNDGADNFIFRDNADNNVLAVISGAGTGGEVIRIDSAGEVGIGTLTPQRKLDVDGTGRFKDSLEVETTSGEFYPPRMTNAQKDALFPTQGALIWNTTSGTFNGYDGTNWKTLSFT